MRALDIAIAAFALRASPTKPPEHERRLVPAIDDANAAMLDRAALSHQRAALIASLWPEAWCCVARPQYETLPAPAMFVGCMRVSWTPPAPRDDARALLGRLHEAFPAVAAASPQLIHAA